MIKHIWAWITNSRLVALQDIDGEVTITIAKVTPFGDIIAKRWWPWNVRIVTLLEDGKVTGASYVKRWKYLK